MELKRCARCGSFFTSESEVCQRCNKKDNADVLKLKNFLEDAQDDIINKDELAIHTGISLKNLNRYLSLEEFSNINFENISEIENKKDESVLL